MKLKSRQLSLLHLALCWQIYRAVGWDYNTPHLWKDKYPTCGGEKQSPVALSFDNVEIFDYHQGEKVENEMLELTNYDKQIEKATITNTGYSVKIQIPEGTNITIDAPFLTVKYRLEYIIFHWTVSGKKLGSEHTIGDTHYPLEIQFVHYNAYIDKTKVMENVKGVAIVSVFYEIVGETIEEAIEADVEEENSKDVIPSEVEAEQEATHRKKREEEKSSEPEVSDKEEETWNKIALDLIIKALPMISTMNQALTMSANETFDIVHLLPKDRETVIHYRGSMTTPPCEEVVDWLIFGGTGKLEQSHLKAFQNITLNYSNPFSGNFRPIQSLNGRRLELRSSLIKDAKGGAKNCDVQPFRLFCFCLLVAVIKRFY